MNLFNGWNIKMVLSCNIIWSSASVAKVSERTPPTAEKVQACPAIWPHSFNEPQEDTQDSMCQFAGKLAGAYRGANSRDVKKLVAEIERLLANR
jgi:hypothetical protein